MKRYKELWEKICTMENFELAYRNASRHKQHYTEVQAINRVREEYLRDLLEEVRSKRYRVSDYEVYSRFTGRKWREISKLPMRDRIVQHAVMIYLEPIFRETFIKDTYSSIKYRGLHHAVHRVKQAVQDREYRYALELDVRKCYPSLDQDILKEKLRRKIKDKDLLWLLDVIIDSCEAGVPIGNYTSQYFNNFYFSDLDHWLKEQRGCKHYFRYCDNLIVLGKDKAWLHALGREIRQYMKERLHVDVNPNWQVYDIDARGINFVGYIIHRDYVRVRKDTKKRFIEKTGRMDMRALSRKDVNVLGSYWGIFKHADCRHLWYKYTKVKTFSELNVRVHERVFMKGLLGYDIVVHGACPFWKRGEQRVRLECTYTDNDGVVHDHVYVTTSGEKIVEASAQLSVGSFPFTARVDIDENGYYELK